MIQVFIVMVKKIKGSSLTFSAQGGRGKEKNLIAAENPVRPSEGAAEGGGIPPRPRLWSGNLRRLDL